MKTPPPPGAAFYSVKAGTRASQCTGPTCGARIFWAMNPRTGRPIPVDCDVVGGEEPSENADERQMSFVPGGEPCSGRGIIHLQVCADADYFKQQR